MSFVTAHNKVVFKKRVASGTTTLPEYVPYVNSVHTFRTEVAIMSNGSPR